LESGRFRKLTETEVKALARETGEPHGHRH
jgi:hypothetical protein